MTAKASSPTPHSALEHQISERICVLSLNRPQKLNALTPGLVAELDARLALASENPEVRVIVLRGEGTSFCSGADLIEALDGNDPGRERDFLVGLASVLRRISAAPKPVIAAIKGHAAGGGAEIALEADLRVGSDDALLWFPDLRIGSTPASAWQLVRLVGKAKASELIMLERRLTADEMHQLGLLQAVVAQHELDDAVLAIARRLRDEVSPRSLRYAKEAIDLAFAATREADLRANINAMLACHVGRRPGPGVSTAPQDRSVRIRSGADGRR